MSLVSKSLLHPMALAFAVGIALIANPASAQEMDHSKMNMPMPKPAAKKPVPAKKPDVRAPVKKAPAKQGPAKAPVKKMKPASAAPKTGIDHSTMPMPADDKSMQGMDHSTMPMPADDKSMQGMDHSTMPMPADDKSMQGMDHAGMTMAPTEPREPIPVLTAADRAAAVPPAGGHTVHDNAIHTYWLMDRLEVWDADDGTGMAWEGIAWIGTDLNRLWLRSEGEREGGRTESADLEVLYGRSIARWWDLVVGVRHDFKPGDAQSFAAVGVMGLAPQKFEVEATAYVGERGQTAARFEVEYDLLLTNRLILQPLVELEFHGKDDPARGIGSGLGTAEAGLRLRYHLRREFAPYIGIVREHAFGTTADYRRQDGEDIDDTRFVAGLRIWF